MLYRLSFAANVGRGFASLWRPYTVTPRAKAAVSMPAPTDGDDEVPETARGKPRVPDAGQLRRTLAGRLSPATMQAVDAAPADMQAAAILGSPEFMWR
jgi:hypothetical protein